MVEYKYKTINIRIKLILIFYIQYWGVSMFKKKNCNEVHKVLEYVKNRSNGLHVKSPTDLKVSKHKDILDLFETFLLNDQDVVGFLDKLLSESSNLSDFDVKMSHIARTLSRFSNELAELSESNMAVVEETTASMSEVENSVNQQSITMDSLNNRSSNLIKLNRQSLSELREINKLKNDVLYNSDDLSNKISELETISKEVDNIVNGVATIAEQTNLLALNASIEAARAGEHGRGFAVVAEEIRKLAENTKEKLDDMNAFMDSIRKNAAESRSSVNNAIKSTHEMSAKLDSVNKSFDNNVENLEQTVEHITELTGVIQQINITTSEISSAMQVAADSSEGISVMAQQIRKDAESALHASEDISQIDNKISKVVKSMTKTVNNGINRITNESFVEHIKSAIISHKKWMILLHDISTNMESQPIQVNGTKCKFGHFYHSINMKHISIQEEWNKVDGLHNELHNQAHIVLESIESKNKIKSKKAYDRAYILSKEIQSLFVNILNNVNKVTKRGEKIFFAQSAENVKLVQIQNLNTIK